MMTNRDRIIPWTIGLIVVGFVTWLLYTTKAVEREECWHGRSVPSQAECITR